MAKRKLKGTSVKKIPKKKLEKMEKTLAKMEEIRAEDTRNLRVIMEAKLKWAREEKEKALLSLKRLQIMIHRLDGAITVLSETIEPPKIEKEENNDSSKN